MLKGYFLAPKTYSYYLNDNKCVMRFKGPAKNMVDPEWYISQLNNPSRTEQIMVTRDFMIDWHSLNIFKKERLHRLGITLGTKREPVFHREKFVGTEPIHIEDLSSLDNVGKTIIKSIKKYIIQLKNENQILGEKLAQKEREIEKKELLFDGVDEISDTTSDSDSDSDSNNPNLEDKHSQEQEKQLMPKEQINNLVKKRIKDLDDP